VRRLQRTRRARGERGAVVIEFAIVVPVFFLIVLALADFALAELSDTAGSNAAREGARVGVLYYDGAHIVGSANHTKISAAVTKKLANNVKGTPTVTVRCLSSDGTPRPGGSCSTVAGDTIDPGHDLIEVTVQWARKGGFSPFVKSGTRTDKAVMRIVGTPPTGSSPPPPACSFAASSANPASAVQSSGDLPAITFQATVNDASACGNPLLTFPAESGYAGAQTMTLVSGNSFTFTMAAGQGAWAAGTKTVTATAAGGAATQGITFVVNDPSTCLITAGAATPASTTQTGGDLPAIVFSVTVSNLAVCGTPTLTFPAQAAYAGAQPMTSAGGLGFTFTMPAGQGTWTAATSPVTANANTRATRAIGLVVSDAPVCMLSNLVISPSSAPVKKTGQKEIQATVTFTVTRSSTTSCAAPTVTVTPGASGSAPDLTSPQPMSCSGVTCTYVVPSGAQDWYPASGARTVTVTASGSTLTGTLTLT
jgi:Flp pilus assembly protein TadG